MKCWFEFFEIHFLKIRIQCISFKMILLVAQVLPHFSLFLCSIQEENEIPFLLAKQRLELQAPFQRWKPARFLNLSPSLHHLLTPAEFPEGPGPRNLLLGRRRRCRDIELRTDNHQHRPSRRPVNNSNVPFRFYSRFTPKPQGIALILFLTVCKAHIWPHVNTPVSTPVL